MVPADCSPSETPTLTQREREVVALAASGLSAIAIARRIYRSHRTVENHLRSAYRKLGVTNRVEMVWRAKRLGLLADEADADPRGASPQLTQALEALGRFNRAFDKAEGSYLDRTALALGDAFGVRCAGICEFDEEAEVVTAVSLAIDGELAGRPAVGVRDTPCQAAIERGWHEVHDGLAQCYPSMPVLRCVPDARSYAGVRLDERRCNGLGVMWFVDDKPLREGSRILDVLRLVAPRVATEMVLARASLGDCGLAACRRPCDGCPAHPWCAQAG